MRSAEENSLEDWTSIAREYGRQRQRRASFLVRSFLACDFNVHNEDAKIADLRKPNIEQNTKTKREQRARCITRFAYKKQH